MASSPSPLLPFHISGYQSTSPTRKSHLVSVLHAVSEVEVPQWCLTRDPMDYTQSMEFSRPEHWSGWPFPSPEDLPNPGIEPRSPALQADSLPAEPQGKPRLLGNY